MARKSPLESKIILKENRVVIYFRNKTFATGYTLKTKSGANKAEKEESFNSQFANGRLKTGWDREKYKVANAKINDKKQLIDNLIREANYKGLPPIKYVEAHLISTERELTQFTITNNTKVVAAFENYIETEKKQSPKITAPRSLQRYESGLSRLKDFANNDVIADIDLDWVYRYAQNLAIGKAETHIINDSNKKKPFERKYKYAQSNATIIRTLKDLKSFLKIIAPKTSIEFPFKKLQDYIDTLSKIDNPSKEVIAMKKKQWTAFKNYRPEKKWEIATHDAYSFCVYTGLRWSDFIRLNDSYVDENNIIKMSAQKNRNIFEVPMNDEAVTIFEKYNRSFVEKFSTNQQQNKNLRSILSNIEIFDKSTTKTITRLKNIERTEIKEFEKFSMHSARRTFVSFCIEANITLDKIRAYTGWTDLRTIQKYMKIFEKDPHKNDLPQF